jgi:hypothetical protein
LALESFGNDGVGESNQAALPAIGGEGILPLHIELISRKILIVVHFAHQDLPCGFDAGARCAPKRHI